jgi:hypothetical protein
LLERLVPRDTAIARREQGAGDAKFFAGREKWIPRKRLEQVKRRAKGAGPEPAACTVARENARVEAILQAQLVLHANASGKADELIAAGQKDVLTVIDLNAVDLERGRAAAEQTASFEELDVSSGVLQPQGCRKTGDPSAHHRYAFESHDSRNLRRHEPKNPPGEFRAVLRLRE